jgi:hypothetical protein
LTKRSQTFKDDNTPKSKHFFSYCSPGSKAAFVFAGFQASLGVFFDENNSVVKMITENWYHNADTEKKKY